MLRLQQAQQHQIAQPGQALRPEQWHVVVRDPLLAARLLALRLNPFFGNHIHLREQRDPIHLHGHLAQALPPAPGLTPALFAAGRDQLVGQEQGPLAFDVLELGQFLAFVMQPVVVLDHGLVAVAAEALVAVGAAQFGADFVAGAFHQGAVFHGPGRVANHREAGRIHFLAGRLPWQQAAQGAPQPHDGVVGDVQMALPAAVGAIEIEALQGFKGRFDKSNGAGVALR